MNTPQGLHWWTSSRSTSQGGQCVEVAVEHLRWHTSSRSTGQGGNCVEVAGAEARWYVRDSKDRQGPVLSVTAPAWAAFVSAVRSVGLGRRR